MDGEHASTAYRSVFLSDIHLGTRGCQADLLLDFLRHMSCERLYLVGDIVDGWRMKGGWYWPQSHNDVVQKICGWRERELPSPTSPATTTTVCAISAACISAE